MWSDIARWSGWFVGGLGVLMWTFALVAQTFVEPIEDHVTAEAIGLAVLVVINVVAFIAALRSERWASIVCIVAGLAFCVFAIATAGHNHWLAAAVSGGPFVFAGAMFLLAEHLDEGADHQIAITTA